MREKSCCEKGMVWVNKYSDIVVPTTDKYGKKDGGEDLIDIQIWRCRICGEVRVDAD